MELKGHEFELIMAGIRDVRKAVGDIEKTVIAHDRDIRAAKVVGKFIITLGGLGAFLVATYDSILNVLHLKH